MMNGETKHADIFTDAEAARYLRLDETSESPEAARRVLHRFVQAGKIHPVKWTKKYLYSRCDLDRFVDVEMAEVSTCNTEPVEID